MKLGVFVPFQSPQATPEMLAEFARRSEDIGLDSIWLGEHVVLFDEMEFGYPGSADGKLPIPQGSGMLDVGTTIAFMAAHTSRIRFGTGVALLEHSGCREGRFPS